jgi:hypothetical protein
MKNQIKMKFKHKKLTPFPAAEVEAFMEEKIENKKSPDTNR